MYTGEAYLTSFARAEHRSNLVVSRLNKFC